MRGFVPDILNIIEKYDLSEYLKYFLGGNKFESRQNWKKIVSSHVHTKQEELWKARMTYDSDFNRFVLFHHCLEAHPLWRLGIKHPELKESIIFSVKLAVTIRDQTDIPSCHKCGKLYQDTAIHIVLQCSLTEKLRDELWCFFLNIEDMFSAYLHSLNDYELFHILIGGYFHYNMSIDSLDEFRTKCITTVHTMSKIKDV